MNRFFVTHLTSVHPRYDTRIFYKMCKSLSKKYEVSLIVADGLGDEIKDRIKIYDVGKSNSRKDRIFNITKKVLNKAMEINSDVYHLHDPELILIGLKLKKLGKKVIFDSHEDVPKQIWAKHYLNFILKKIFSYIYSKYEITILKKFDFVIAATSFIRNKFLKHGINAIDINNFPLLDEFVEIDLQSEPKNNICYIGTLYKTRGIIEIIKAVENLNVKLVIAGKFYDESFEKEVKSLKGWKKVDYRGFVGRKEIVRILKESKIGIVTLYPTMSYIESYPVKMFEYMSAGLPVIASNFPLWKKIIEENNCGICVDPLKPEEIANVIKFIMDNPLVAKEMGNNGRNAILEKYNWNNEEKKLFEVYEKVINDYI